MNQIQGSDITTSLIENKQQKSALQKLLCCVFDSDEELELLANQVRTKKKRASMLRSSEEREKKIDLQLLGNLVDRNYSIVRITQKNFFVDVLGLKGSKKCQLIDPQQQQRTILYSQYDNGIRLEKEDLQNSLPEKVLKYLGKRIKEIDPSLVVDALCRSGAAAIQFATMTEALVCGMDSNIQYLLNARNNASIYNVLDQIELFQIPLLKLPQILHPDSDVLYLHPCYLKPSENAPFSLLTHIVPDIKQLLQVALQCGHNVILVLPKHSSLPEIAQIIAFYLRKMESVIFQYEIQQVQIDGYLENYVVYLGDVAQLQQQDEYRFMVNYLLEDNNQKEGLANSTYIVLKRMMENKRFIMDLILQCREQAQSNSETALQAFLHKLLYRNLITKDEISDLYGEELNDIVVQDQTPKYNGMAQSAETFDPKNNLMKEPQMPKPKASRHFNANFCSFNNKDASSVPYELKESQEADLMALLNGK